MLPRENYKMILAKMNECMNIPTGLFDRLETFQCTIFKQFDNDWREVTEIRRLNDQFRALIYPIGRFANTN